MSSATIHAVLRRRAMADDRLGLGGGRDDDDAYWASPPRLYDFSKHQLLKDEPPVCDHPPPPPPAPPSLKPEPPLPAPSPSPSLAPVSSSSTPSTDAHLCLLALQGTGVSWGVRKRVRFVHCAARRANANAFPLMTPALAESAPALAARQADEKSSSNVKPEPKPEAEAEESVQDGREEVKTGEEKKKRRRRKNGFTLWRPKKRAHRERKNIQEGAGKIRLPLLEGMKKKEEKKMEGRKAREAASGRNGTPPAMDGKREVKSKLASPARIRG